MFVIPDVAEPEARSYDVMIEEIGEVGEWTPIVGADHVPASLANAPDGSLASMVGQMLRAPGGCFNVWRACG